MMFRKVTPMRECVCVCYTCVSQKISTHLLQKVSLLGWLVGGILLLPSAQNHLRCGANPSRASNFWLNFSPVDVDRLKVGGIATFVLEIALPPGRVDGTDVVWKEKSYVSDQNIFTFLSGLKIDGKAAHHSTSLWQSDDTLVETQSWPSPCNAPFKNQLLRFVLVIVNININIGPDVFSHGMCWLLLLALIPSITCRSS